MLNHVSARCARYRLLFPSRNIESIVTLGEQTRIVPWKGGRANRGCLERPTLDMRRLLEEESGPEMRSCIQLFWVSTDAERRAALIVDSVDEIVNSHIQCIEPVPFLPKRVRSLCDGVLRDPDATYRLSVRLDAAWPVTFADRRLWLQALVSVMDAGFANWGDSA